MTTPAALRELASLSSYIEDRDGVMVRVDKAGGCAPATRFEIELWSQLRTAAAEGGEAVAWQGRFFDDVRQEWGDWRPMTESEATTYAGISGWQTRPLFTHPPEVARDAADAERWRTLRDSLPREYNHDKDKGYIRWYLPRARGGFMGLQEHIDSIISSKAATSDAALRARVVG